MYRNWKRGQFGSWFGGLEHYLMSAEFDKWLQFIKEEYRIYKIAPTKERLFYMYRRLPPTRVRVCIVGQDPYPQEYEGRQVASGIAFGTEQPKCPQSLRNIFKEVIRSLHADNDPNPLEYYNEFSLISWVQQGVLLLNTYPTIRIGGESEHRSPVVDGGILDSKRLTGETISLLRDSIIVFMGGEAASLIPYVHESCKYLTVSHPSSKSWKKTDNPLWGSDFALTINAALKSAGKREIQWI